MVESPVGSQVDHSVAHRRRREEPSLELVLRQDLVLRAGSDHGAKAVIVGMAEWRECLSVWSDPDGDLLSRAIFHSFQLE